MSTCLFPTCLMTVILVPAATSVLLEVECDVQPYREQFPKIFSLDIFQKDKPLVHLGEGNGPKNLALGETVQNPSGTLNEANGSLKATVDISCESVSEIECELFGMPQDQGNFQKYRFEPKFVFSVGTGSPLITTNPNKGAYAIGDVILFTCSTHVGTNASIWRWTVQHTEQRVTKHTEFHPVPEHDFDVSTTVLSQCSYQTASKYVYIPSKDGEATIRCETGNGRVADSTITIGRQNERLSTHLFLTSFLVYVHFIILPSVFAYFGDRIAFRLPERLLMRTLRTGISFFVGITFLIWWVVVLSISNEDRISSQDILSYIMYAVIDLIFIFFYTFTRFTANLSRCFEKKRQRYLYNARVAASYGAVMTPVICWIMIKCHEGKSILWLEILFGIVTASSFLGFVCVSKNREEKYWEIEEKSQL